MSKEKDTKQNSLNGKDMEKVSGGGGTFSPTKAWGKRPGQKGEVWEAIGNRKNGVGANVIGTFDSKDAAERYLDYAGIHNGGEYTWGQLEKARENNPQYRNC